MQQLERFLNGLPRRGARIRFRIAGHPPIHPLEHRSLAPAYRPHRRRIHFGLAAMRGKGPQHRQELLGERLEEQIRIPQAQIKSVGHCL